jgi:EmrB/QacA subfamily drug resistance transporter
MIRKLESKWLTFIIVAIAQFMVVLDTSINNVALPAIKRSLHFSTSTLQWVITAYALTFGGFLLLGGRAADQFGRRRTLMIGMSGFTLFSFLIGISDSSTLLIALRALQGMAAAFMSPAALSIVLATFKEGKDRNRALAGWTLVATGGAAVGLLVGGALTQFVGWRWNYFINVPVGLLILTLIPRYVPLHESEDTDKHLDLPGAALVTSGLIALVLALSQAPTWGWLDAKTLGIFGASMALIAGFLYNESKSKHPLMPLGIFKIRNVAGGNLIMAPIYASMLGLFYLLSLYIQNVLGFSPLETGLAFLPFPIVLGIMSTRTPKLVARFGFKPLLIVGPLIIAVGMALLTRLPVHGNYWLDVFPTTIIMPLGVGLTFMPVIAAATSGVKPQEAGLASGLVNTSQQMGGALGLAILSGVSSSITSSDSSLGRVAAGVHGYDVAFIVATGLVLSASIMASFVITQKKKPGSKTGILAVPVLE